MDHLNWNGPTRHGLRLLAAAGAVAVATCLAGPAAVASSDMGTSARPRTPAGSAARPSAPPVAPDPAGTGNLNATITLTNTPRLLVGLCLELRDAGWRAPDPDADMQGLIAETGATVTATASWCRHYLWLQHR